MSLGTSIFLSSILFAIIILFIVTKDRWNWKKIILWPMLVVVAVLILLIGGYYIYQYIYESKSKVPDIYESKLDLAEIQTNFWGISLDSTKSDIKFLKGNASYKESNDRHWVYAIGERSGIHITFKNDKIYYIIYFGKRPYGPPLQGVYIGAGYDEIIGKFGSPSYVSMSEDELQRTLSYDKYNLTFGFKEAKVYLYGIYNPAFGPVKFPKEKNVTSKK